jgi:O-antigen/teichoic acid export membrane protein
MRRVLQNVGWLLGGKGINAALSLIYLALATRSLGLEAFGALVLIVGLGQAISAFATFQTWQVVVRWGSPGREDDTVLGFALALDGISIVVGAVLTIVLFRAGGTLLPLSPEHSDAGLAYCLVTLLAIRSTPIGILRLNDRFAWSAAADSVTAGVRCVGAGLAGAFAPGVTAFLAAWAAAELATAAAYWLLAARCRPIAVGSASLRRLPGQDRQVWRFVWSTNLSASLTAGSRQAVLLMVGAWGGAALAGLYRVASQLGQALLKLAQSLLRAIYPELVRDPVKAPDLALRLAGLAATAGIAALAIAGLMGNCIIDLVVGRSFSGALVPMIVLALAASVEFAGASFEALLVARGQAGTALLLRAVPTLASLAVLPFALERLQATGAALSVLVASTAATVGFVVTAQVHACKFRKAVS